MAVTAAVPLDVLVAFLASTHPRKRRRQESDGVGGNEGKGTKETDDFSSGITKKSTFKKRKRLVN